LLEHLAMLIQDLRFAFRQFRKNPGFGLTVVLMLALGTGASVAIFAFVDAALIKPLPFADATQLVDVTETGGFFRRANLSYLDYLDWKEMNKALRSLDVYRGTSYLLRGTTGTQPVAGTRVSDGFFRTLGVTPILGRDFQPGEDLPSAPKAVLLSYSAWQHRFGGRRDVLGETVSLSGVLHTIVGVLPRNFYFAPRGDTELWATLHSDDSCAAKRNCHILYGLGRLKPGVSIKAARADLEAVAKLLEKQYPDSNRERGASVLPLYEAFAGDIRPILLALLGGAGLLLLIACVNVSSLLLVRSEGRKREIAVRGALGASPSRLVRQFLTEGILLAAAGSLLGVAAASSAIQVLVRLIPRDMMHRMPYFLGLGLNWRVAAFAAAVAAAAAMVFSLTPVLRLSSAGVGTEMRSGLAEGGRGASGALWKHLGANLVVLELAIAMVLLVGAALLGKSFYRLLRVDLNFQPDHLALVEVGLPDDGYPSDEPQIRVHREILRQIAILPGVKSVSTTSALPANCNCNTDWIRLEGRPYNGVHNEVTERDVSPDYLATIHAKLLKGRFFTPADDASKPRVVVINQALARKYFPGEDPIDRRIGDTQLTPKSMKTIIGVIDDVREGSLEEEIWPAVYYPFDQDASVLYGRRPHLARPCIDAPGN
jgi:macrolide transport system ATP-binding/permease protein